MDIIAATLLGALQGATEFIPVSSSGHLILARAVFDIPLQDTLAFDAVLQLASALALAAYFRADLKHLASSALRVISGKLASKEEKALLLALFIGTIPAVAAGLVLEDLMDTAFRGAAYAAAGLCGGSLLIMLAERLRLANPVDTVPGPLRSFFIGCFQALALFPGVSRSGSTMSGGMLAGLSREGAVRFSFLLAIPIIGGTGLKKLLDIAAGEAFGATAPALAAGAAASFIVSLLAIGFLMRYVRTHSLMPFVWYRFALAFAVLVLLV